MKVNNLRYKLIVLHLKLDRVIFSYIVPRSPRMPGYANVNELITL